MKRKFNARLLEKSIGCTLILSSCLYSAAGTASNFQSFIGINYSNPAELAFLVKDLQIIGSYNVVMPDIYFNGVVTVPDPFRFRDVVSSGAAENTGNYTSCYGRFAARINKMFVAGIDVTQPFNSITEYPRDSVARYASTKTQVSSVNYAPNIAFIVPGLQTVSVGAGVDFMNVRAALDKMLPSLTFPFGAGPDILITNHADAWTEGWHAGVAFNPVKGTYLGLSYFSVVTPILKGESAFSGFPTNYDLFARLKLPATTVGSATQYFSEDWLVRLTTRFTEWSRLNRAVLHNTAGPDPDDTAIVPLHYRSTWEADIGTRYNITKTIYIGGLVGYDQTPTNDRDRTLGLPEADRVVFAALIGYKFTKALSIELNYAHTTFLETAPLNHINPNDGTVTRGGADVFSNVAGVRVTVDL